MNQMWATAVRVFRQLRHDHRTIGMMILLPTMLMWLLSWILGDSPQTYDSIGPQLLGLFPLTIMFVITAVTVLRERTSGTLERLMASPISKGSLIGGYAAAFGFFAIIQALTATLMSIAVFGMDDHGNAPWIVAVAVTDALLGTSLGLAVSALANSEFQAVQFMPVTLFPQFLLCGFLVPRESLPDLLASLSNILPLSYSIDALAALLPTGPTSDYWPSVLTVVGFIIANLLIGSLTLRRRTA